MELQASATADPGKADRRRQAIIRAATEVFLRHGYVGATTDEVAAGASVSKQTLYKHFADKQRLFAEVILETTVQLVDGLATVAGTLRDTDDVRSGLRELAAGFLRGLLDPDVLRLRRLVVPRPTGSPRSVEPGRPRLRPQPGHPRRVPAAARRPPAAASPRRPDPGRVPVRRAGHVLADEPGDVRRDRGAAVDRGLDRIADAAVETFLRTYG